MGQWIGRRLTTPAIVGLDGPLAVGKTWLAKGIVSGIGDFDAALVKSPAYNLVHEYTLQEPSRSVIHIDFYRLESLASSDAMLFTEILEDPAAIVLVEWASKFLAHLAPEYLSIRLEPGTIDNWRTVHLRNVGDCPGYQAIVEESRAYADAGP